MQPCYTEPPLLRRSSRASSHSFCGSRSPLSASWTIAWQRSLPVDLCDRLTAAWSAPPHQTHYLIRSKCAGIVVFKNSLNWRVEPYARGTGSQRGYTFLHVPCVRYATETTVPPNHKPRTTTPAPGGAPPGAYRGFHGYPIKVCFDMVALNRNGPAHALHDLRSDFRGPCNVEPRHGSGSSSKSDGNDKRRRARCLYY